MTSITQKRRWGAGLAITAVMVMVQIVGGATAAEARCVSGNPTPSTLGAVSANPVVTETPKDGTCNNNNNYTGYLRISNTNLQIDYAEVWIQNNGSWRLQFSTSTSASPGSEFSFSDNNSNVLQVLCWITAIPERKRYCGWGGNVGPADADPGDNPTFFNQPKYHGVNSGF